MLTYSEMLAYTGVPELPEDFDAYWDAAVAESREDGDAYTWEDADSPEDGVVCGYVTFRGPDGARIFCRLAYPAQPCGRTPGVCLFHGYGGAHPERSARVGFDDLLPYVREGMTALWMAARGQYTESEDPLTETDFSFPHLYLKDVLAQDARRSYCRGIFTDAAKCARILMGMEWVDETRVYAVGFSQGGDLTLACAALEPRVSRIVFGGIGIADCARYVRERGYVYAQAALTPSLRAYFDERGTADEARLIRRMSYFDELLFAPRVRAEVLNVIGGQDRTCPTAGQLALYNRLTAEKRCVLWQEGGHAPPPEFYATLPARLMSTRFPEPEQPKRDSRV